MLSCKRADSWKIASFPQLTMGFKTQKIVNQWHQPVAEEILYNGQYSAAIKPTEFFSSQVFIDALLCYTELRAQQTLISKLFVNIEPNTLCDSSALAKLTHLHQQLKQYQCELNIEVTERLYCGPCLASEAGLLALKAEGIGLALDDYDIYSQRGDKRSFELNVFNYVKIIRPVSANQRLQLQTFLRRKPLHDGQILVIENIEHASDLAALKNIQGLPSKHYFQGYWFYRPQAIQLNSKQATWGELQ